MDPAALVMFCVIVPEGAVSFIVQFQQSICCAGVRVVGKGHACMFATVV